MRLMNRFLFHYPAGCSIQPLLIASSVSQQKQDRILRKVFVHCAARLLIPYTPKRKTGHARTMVRHMILACQRYSY